MPIIPQFLRILLGTLTQLGNNLLLAYLYSRNPEAGYSTFLPILGLTTALFGAIGLIRLNILAMALIMES